MRKHQKELLEITVYVFAIIWLLVLITWFSILLNHSLNLI